MRRLVIDTSIYDRILTGLRDHLERHRLDDINDLVATLEYPSGPDACEGEA